MDGANIWVVVVAALAIPIIIILGPALSLGLHNLSTRVQQQQHQQLKQKLQLQLQKRLRQQQQQSKSPLGAYWQEAVATNGIPCARIGADILRRGGSAVEAAIAALFCEGVACPQSMGVGGGFFMVIYNRTSGTAEALNARETAPASASANTYSGRGVQETAVPSALRGYWRAFEKYRSYNVEWKDLIEPTIKLCEEGITITPYLEKKIASMESLIMTSRTLRKVLLRPDWSLPRAGDVVKRPMLAKTLKVIAAAGNVDPFYNGSIGDAYVSDVNSLGGRITKQDLLNYEVVWEKASVTTLHNGLSVYTTQLPSSGPLLGFMLNILDGFVPAASSATTWHRVTEVFKYGFGHRTEAGDPHFEDVSELMRNLTSREYAEAIRALITDNRTWTDPAHYGFKGWLPDDHGTAHVSVLAANGDAVSVTSSLNNAFGVGEMSLSTGIILNNQMADFSTLNMPDNFGLYPAKKNFIKPGKRPLSSMSPAIIVDGNGDVRLVAGAEGGSKATTATVLTIINCLWFNMTIKEAIDARRIHHQLNPMQVEVEDGFSEDDAEALRRMGHKVLAGSENWFSATGIAVNRSLAPYQTVFANADSRRGGIVAGF